MYRRIRWLLVMTTGLVVVFALTAAGYRDTASQPSEAVPGPAPGQHGSHGAATSKDPAKAAEFQDAMRKLWEDHITWTRLFIVSAAADLPDMEPTAGRLLQNQDDIGNSIKPYYGDAAGEHLTALLRDHILIAGELLGAAKTGDDAATSDARTRWYANGDDIARFLNSANAANWKLGPMKQMMREHLDLTLKEAVARLSGNYAADIAAYEEVHDAILEMADMLSAGIIAQHPDKF